MNAAVIKFNSLSYTVGAAAKDDDFSSVSRVRLAIGFKSRIKIRGGRFEFGAAGVNGFIDGVYAKGLPVLAKRLLLYA